MDNYNSPVDQKSHPMDALLSQDGSVKIPKIGELVTGMVISVSKNEIYLDLAGLTTGVIRGREIYDESADSTDLKIGDQATATVIGLDNENGYMELSFRK